MISLFKKQTNKQKTCFYILDRTFKLSIVPSLGRVYIISIPTLIWEDLLVGWKQHCLGSDLDFHHLSAKDKQPLLLQTSQ